VDLPPWLPYAGAFLLIAMLILHPRTHRGWVRVVGWSVVATIVFLEGATWIAPGRFGIANRDVAEFGEHLDGAEAVGAIPGDFTVPPTFAGGVEALEALTGHESRDLLVSDHDGYPVPTGGAAIDVDASTARAIVARAQEKFLAQGSLLFRTVRLSRDGRRHNAIGVMPTADAYEVMELLRIGGPHANASDDPHAVTTAQIVEWFRETALTVPLRYNAIGSDFIEVRLLRAPDDPARLAEGFMKICPDVRREPNARVDRLTREIMRDKWLYCWWGTGTGPE
jgi:hypothetical protein